MAKGQMPEWFQQYVLNNIMHSQESLNTPYRPYPVEHMFAPRNEFETAASNLTQEQNPHLPFMNRANDYSMAGAEGFPTHLQHYMNPYQEAVTNRIAQLGNRNLHENVLPALEAKFLRLGQHGGTQHRDWAQRAGRDIQSEISGRQAEALSHGYGQAMAGFNADQARLLDAARHQSELGAQATASRLAEIANQRQQAGLERELAERPRQALAHQHRERENWPFTLRAAHTATINGLPGHLTPQNNPRSWHRRDWQGAGMQVGSKLLGNLFGGI